MLFCEKLSDFSILVEENRIPCHKFVLNIASPVFEAMFDNQMQECSTNELKIFDFSFETVESFVKFMYDDPSIQSDIEENPFQLLLIADKYGVSELVQSAEISIIAQINEENAFEMLQFAQNFERTEIKTTVFRKLVKVYIKSEDKALFQASMCGELFKEFRALMFVGQTLIPRPPGCSLTNQESDQLGNATTLLVQNSSVERCNGTYVLCGVYNSSGNLIYAINRFYMMFFEIRLL